MMPENKVSKVNWMPFLLVMVAGLILDRATKYLVVKWLKPIQEFTLIEGVFNLTYLENTGAAFSVLRGKVEILVLITAVITTLCIGFLVYNIRNNVGIEKKSNGRICLDWLLNISIALIIGGSLGNLIDRITLGYVVDFLDFTLINFPIFNVADCFVVVGGLLAAISTFFRVDEDSEKDK